MKVLLSVFECNPYRGSDSYVGWSYLENMAKLNEVYALTRSDNKEDIEKYLAEQPALRDRIHFTYVGRAQLFSKYFYKLNRYLGFLGSYFVWQKASYKAAKKICAQNDISVCHHVTIADFRCAGYLWKCGKPFVLGPIGGGQETPVCLKEYVKGHEKSERFRSVMNKATTMLPSYRKALRNAAVIYSSNDETTACISRRMNGMDTSKLIQMTELCIDTGYLAQREELRKDMGHPIRIIVSGRLIYRKGIALLLDALTRVKTEVPFVVDIFGEGDQAPYLKKKTDENGLQDKVLFHGKVGFEEMQNRYKDADIYILPSLRETTGTAVFEAMANKLPVIALNQNGVKHIVEADSGILIDLRSKEQVLNDFAAAIKVLIEDPALRIKQGECGFNKLKEKYTWERRVRLMNDVYSGICKEEKVQ